MKLPNSYGSVTKLSGKRRKPYIVRKTIGWEIDKETDKLKRKVAIIGYARTRSEGLEMLAQYNESPYDTVAAKMTFAEVYEEFKKLKFPTISVSNQHSYNASYAICQPIYNRVFKELKLADLQKVIDNSGKNYPTLRKIKVLFGQLYTFAMKNEICNKDYSKFIDISQYKDKNPNAFNREKFSEKEINHIWANEHNRYYQIVLMLIYSGTRISELLDLKKENVNLDEQYFDIIKSKTEAGIRRVPIADKTLPFFISWYESSECEYLLHTEANTHFEYRNYYDSYWTPVMEDLGLKHKPHDTRHTCISMLTEKNINPTIIKKIVGHGGAMSLTERVYTHLDVKELLEAINKI